MSIYAWFMLYVAIVVALMAAAAALEHLTDRRHP